jgi:uncharacterized delta-60 repeat protein
MQVAETRPASGVFSSLTAISRFIKAIEPSEIQGKSLEGSTLTPDPSPPWRGEVLKTSMTGLIMLFTPNRRSAWLMIGVTLVLTVLNLAQKALAAPGDPMASFGTSGQVKTFVQALSSSGKAMKVDRFGRIVLAGSCVQAGLARPCVARYLADGNLDASFRALTTPGWALLAEEGGFDALEIQPDGRIMLGGTCNGLFCLVTLADDGTFLEKEDVNMVANSPYRFISALALQRDQNVLAVGNCQRNSQPLGCIMRFTSAGKFDLSFFAQSLSLNSTGVFLRAVALQSNGRSVVGGTCQRNGRYSFCVARFNLDGLLDENFGNNGVAYFDLASGASEVTALAVLPDDRIIAVGGCQDGVGQDICAVRLLPDGALDTEFGTDGIAISATTENRYANALTIAEDGALYIGATCNLNQCVFKLKSDGKRLDEAFGTTGGAIRNTATVLDQGRAIALTRSGDVLLGGSCNAASTSAFCLLQLEGGPRGARACSLDVDGDGRVLPLIDGLILNRLSRGARGTAALQGVQFDGAAMRTTYESIRDFLFLNCGMRFD